MEKDKAGDDNVLVTGQARDLKLPVEACLYEKNLDPCIIVIFGASGDLAGLKLIPALYSLFLTGGLPSPCYIVGCARTPMSREQFQERMAGAVKKAGKDMSRWQEFVPLLDYIVLDYGNTADYESLANF